MVSLLLFIPFAATPADVSVSQIEAIFNTRDRTSALVQTAKRNTSRAPEIHIAYGLVLLQKMQRGAADDQFAKAIQLQDTNFPAWQLRLSQLGSKAKETPKLVADFTKILLRENHADPRSRTIFAQAEWLGKFLKAAALSETNPAHQMQFEDLANSIQATLQPTTLGRRFSLGMADMDSIFEDIVTEEAAKKTAQKKKDSQRYDDIVKRAESQLELAKLKSEDLKVSQSDLRKAVNETMVDIGRELGRLEQDYQFLSQEFEGLAEQDRELQLEYGIWQTQVELKRRSNSAIGRPGVGTMSEYRQLLLQDEQFLRRSQELRTTAGQVEQRALAVANQAHRILNLKATILNSYQTSTASAAKQDASNKKWQLRLNKTSEMASQKKTRSAAKSTPPRISFRRLLPLNIDTEKDRLLLSLKGKP